MKLVRSELGDEANLGALAMVNYHLLLSRSFVWQSFNFYRFLARDNVKTHTEFIFSET